MTYTYWVISNGLRVLEFFALLAHIALVSLICYGASWAVSFFLWVALMFLGVALKTGLAIFFITWAGVGTLATVAWVSNEWWLKR